MHAAGALTVPLCLAMATGLWVWVLPETKGIELPALRPGKPPLPVVTAATQHTAAQAEPGTAKEGQ